MDIKGYWQAILQQDADKIADYFHSDAYINWHNTNEHFTVEQFVAVNCLYPGEWEGEIERVEWQDNLVISVVKIFSHDKTRCFHVTSFFTMENKKISVLDEYWGEDGPAPLWRTERQLGTALQ